MILLTRYCLPLLLVLGGMLPLAAKTLTFENEKCRCDVPDGWTEQKTEGNQASFLNADQSKTFVLRIIETSRTITLDNDSFIKGFEGSIVSNGLSITNRQHVVLGGLDAYAVDSTINAPAGTVYDRMIVTLANGFAYGFNISKLNGKPWEDDELNAIQKSFTFTEPPAIHKAADPAEKFGEVIGYAMVIFLIPAILIKWFLNRRKKAAQA